MWSHEVAVTPRWLPGGDAQTIWAAKGASILLTQRPILERERWCTPDDDFIDVDWLRPVGANDDAPLLVLFHGLEGSARSHYAQALANEAQVRGWRFVVPHFRGCSGEDNWAPRAYHSGDYQEIHWILSRLRECAPSSPMYAAGVSLGGNALLRWAQEAGGTATRLVQAVASVSAPLDLAAAGASIDQGRNRWIYARMFLQTMVAKARRKYEKFPGLFDLAACMQATTLRAFDNAFTAPLHGFQNVDDYWCRASARPRMQEIRLPTLVLNARNDPFVPAESLPTEQEVGPYVRLWQPAQGGHCGFPAVSPESGWRGHVSAMPRALTDWFSQSGAR